MSYYLSCGLAIFTLTFSCCYYAVCWCLWCKKKETKNKFSLTFPLIFLLFSLFTVSFNIYYSYTISISNCETFFYIEQYLVLISRVSIYIWHIYEAYQTYQSFISLATINSIKNVLSKNAIVGLSTFLVAESIIFNTIWMLAVDNKFDTILVNYDGDGIDAVYCILNVSNTRITIACLYIIVDLIVLIGFVYQFVQARKKILENENVDPSLQLQFSKELFNRSVVFIVFALSFNLFYVPFVHFDYLNDNLFVHFLFYGLYWCVLAVCLLIQSSFCPSAQVFA